MPLGEDMPDLPAGFPLLRVSYCHAQMAVRKAARAYVEFDDAHREESAPERAVRFDELIAAVQAYLEVRARTVHP
jgi:hypothetical protein